MTNSFAFLSWLQAAGISSTHRYHTVTEIKAQSAQYVNKTQLPEISIKYSRLTRRKCTTSPRQNASMGFTEFCTATKCQARRGTLEGSICRTESTGGICGLRGRTSHFQDTHRSSAAPCWLCRVHTQAAKQCPGLQAPEQWLVLLGPATGFRGNVCLSAKQWAGQNKTRVPAACCRSSCTWIDEIWQPTACQQPCVSVLPT